MMHARFAVICRPVLAFLGLTWLYDNALVGQQGSANPLRVTLDASNIPTHNPSVYVAAALPIQIMLHTDTTCLESS